MKAVTCIFVVYTAIISHVHSLSIFQTKSLSSSILTNKGLCLQPYTLRGNNSSGFVRRSSTMKLLSSNSNNELNNDDEFWKMQKALAESMSDYVEKPLRDDQKQKYEKKVNSLVFESFYFSVMIFSLTWFFASNPFTSFSYLLGATLGTAYCFGLGKYVQTLGGNAYDVEDVKGSGVGSARFAFLVLLFIVVGKFRGQGLQEIPAIIGFFTYQLASLSQGLKETVE